MDQTAGGSNLTKTPPARYGRQKRYVVVVVVVVVVVRFVYMFHACCQFFDSALTFVLVVLLCRHGKITMDLL